MKKLMLALALLVAMATVSLAAPCAVNGTLTTYVGYGSAGCDYSTYNFSNFTLNTGYINFGSGNIAIDPNNITLSPTTTPGGAVGFNINTGYYTVLTLGSLVGGNTVTNGTQTDINISYTITGGSQFLVLTQNATVTGTGSAASVAEQAFLGNTAGGTLLGSGTVNAANPSTVISLGGIYSTITVVKDINAQLGSGANADVHQSGILNATVVPEPMTMSLLGVGLLGLGFFGRRLRK